MSEAIETPRVNPATNRLRTIVSSRRDKMFGLAEILALGASCLLFLLVLLSYLYFLIPARSKVTSLEADRTRLLTNVQKMTGIVGTGQSTAATAQGIIDSLDQFETAQLVRADAGRMTLYAELNLLIAKNGLRNTSGPTYAPLDPLGTKSTPGRSVTTKWQSVYPGIGVLVTVEGPYQNVRHFIQDIEKSKQFVIINQVELQRAQENSSASVTPESGTRASLVSLQLNLATYFQREPSEQQQVSQEQ